MALSNMYAILGDQNRANQGEPYLRRAIAIGEKSFRDTLKMAALQHNLAALEASRGNDREAARILRKVIATEEQLLGSENPQLVQSLRNYSHVMHRLHQETEARVALTMRSRS